MSNSAKTKSLSLAELKRQLEQQISEKTKSDAKTAGNKGLSARVKTFIEQHLSSYDDDYDNDDDGADESAMNSDDLQEFESWAKRVRVCGPFFNQFGKHTQILDLRRNALIKNSDALNDSVLRKLARDFESRWIYTESEARQVFGAYLAPLETGGLIFRITGSRDLIKEQTGMIVEAGEDVTLICPSPSFIEILSYYSTKLNFVVGFVVAYVQQMYAEQKIKARTRVYRAISFETNRMLLDESSPLQRALRAPVPPPAELHKVAVHFGLKSDPKGKGRLFWGMGQQPLHAIVQRYKELFPVASASGVISLFVDTTRARFNLICAPAVLQAVLDSLQADSAGAGKEQMHAAQSVMLALGDSERDELVAAVYGAATRGELQVTQERRLTAACLGKLGTTQWPTVASRISRELLELVISDVFELYEGLAGIDDAKSCVPQDLLRHARSVVRRLAAFSDSTSLIRLFAAAPDRMWINICDVQSVLGIKQDRYEVEYRNYYDPNPWWLHECIFGWFCGIVDLAFKVDKKGVKSEVTAFRVNRAALKRAIMPDVDEQAADEPQLMEQPWNRYSSKVEVLPNGEVLCPPDLHPAIKFCLATILSYVRTNTFSVFAAKTRPHVALGLTSSDVLAFLQLISRNPVPKIVSDKLSSPEEKPASEIGALAPDFVITGASQESAQAVLNELDGKRFFAVEMATGVWGFFDRYSSRPSDSLDAFKVATTQGRCKQLGRVMKNLSKCSLNFTTEIAGLHSIGSMPVAQHEDRYRRAGINAPSLAPFSRYCEFFDLKHLGKDWEDEKVGVEIFSLVPAELRSTKAFLVAMAPCMAIMKTRMNYL